MPLVPGARLGPYEILSLVGTGGMGEVYRARDARLGRDVAIKTLPPAWFGDAERRARFDREARILATLNHPNIGAIYGLESADGAPALVLEFVDGPTLSDRVAGAALPIRTALTFGVQIADALHAAHARGIVHRDLKPANIKIGADAVVKILDFGIAKAVATANESEGEAESMATTAAGTRRGVIIGTAAYMSPEQARGEPVDKRSDIWAFGCVLYEMLTGRSPFVAVTVSTIIVNILDRDPAWDKLPVSTPASVRRVLQRCLEKDPNRRLHDIADARLELEDALAGRDGDAPADTSRRTLRRIVQAAAAVAILAVVAWAGARLMRRSTPPAPVNVKVSIPSGSATADPGRLLGPPVVSPDGSAIVVSLTIGKQSGLFVRRLDSDRLTALESTAGAAYPFWSPDSKTIAFFADGKLKGVAASGGNTVTLCAAPAERGGAWSLQGTIIFGINGRGVFRCDTGSGQPVEITKLDESLGENSHRYPVFLPDGNRFLYFARTNDLEKRGVYLDSLDRRTPRRRVLVADGQFALGRDPWSGEYYLLSQQAGRIFAQPFDARLGSTAGGPIPILGRAGQVSVSDTGVLVLRSEVEDRSRLVWFDRAGREVGGLGAPTDYWQVALSPDDRRVAAVKHDYLSGAFAIWSAIADRGQLEPVSNSNRAMSPVWSPDGNTLYYDDGIGRRILRRTLEPKGAEEVVETPKDFFQLRAASSSAVLAAEKWEGPNAVKKSISWRPTSGGNWTDLPPASMRETQPAFSPDGRWMAFVSERTGSPEVYISGFPEGPTYRISQSGGQEPHWRGDGHELFFLGSDGAIQAVDVTKGFDAAAPATLFRASVRRGSEGPVFAVTRDGQRFLVIVGEKAENADSIDLVLNWPGLIKR
jgi:eukaryotic-like serine/threonine-protein kinase